MFFWSFGSHQKLLLRLIDLYLPETSIFLCIFFQVQVTSKHKDMFAVDSVKVTFKDRSQFEAKFPSQRIKFKTKIVTAKYFSRLELLEKYVYEDLRHCCHATRMRPISTGYTPKFPEEQLSNSLIPKEWQIAIP